MKLTRIFHRRRNQNGKKASQEKTSDSQSKTSRLLKRLGTRLTNKDSTTDVLGSSSFHLDDDVPRHHSDHHSIYQVIELNNSSSSFQEQFEAIHPTKKPRALVLTNFVESATRHDIYALRDVLSNEKLHWKKVQLVDRAPSSDCRRWRYKKDNICHHIKDICASRDIGFEFEASMELVVEEMPSFKKVVDMISQVEKDNEITQLTLRGNLDDVQAEQVFQLLTSLFSKDDRSWVKVRINVSFGGHDVLQYQQWKQTMEEYAALFAQMKWQYSIPIDMSRPYQHQ